MKSGGAMCLLAASTPAALVSAFVGSRIVLHRGDPMVSTAFTGKHRDVPRREMTQIRGESYRPWGIKCPAAPTHKPRSSWAACLHAAAVSLHEFSADHQPPPSVGGAASSIACDQCGEIGLRRPLNGGEGGGDVVLAVCNAPGCGLKFAQCPRCEIDYEGCCSVACQASYSGSNRGQHDDFKQGHSAPIYRGKARTQSIPTSGPSRRPPMTNPAADSPGVDNGSARVGRADEAGQLEENGDDAVNDGEITVPTADDTKLSKINSHIGTSGTIEGHDPTSDHVRDCSSTGENSDAPTIDAEGYASRHSTRESSSLTAVREATDRTSPGGAHMVSGHLQGEVLKLLTRLCGAKRVLDVGTFTGYSALAFAEALPWDGVVLTLESDPRAAETAQNHFNSSPHGSKIELVLGQAMDSINMLAEQGAPQFDVIFIDADKKRYWDYYEKVLAGTRPLLAPAGVLLADNVLFHDLVPLSEALEADNAVCSDNDPGVSENIPSETKNAGSVRTQTGGTSPNITPRRLKIAKSLDGFNKQVANDDRVEVLMLPLRDGLSVVRWKKEGYPHLSW